MFGIQLTRKKVLAFSKDSKLYDMVPCPAGGKDSALSLSSYS